MSEEKKENLEKATLSEGTTAAETPYVVMGELLLRAVERSGVAVGDDDRTLVSETMRLEAFASRCRKRPARVLKNSASPCRETSFLGNR